MIIVLDVSAAIEIIFEQEKSIEFEEEIRKSSKVITSDLFKIEIANVIWKYVRAGELEKSSALPTMELALNLIDEFIEISENNEESLNESLRLNHSTYDMLYFTLARRTGGLLLTKDKRLKELCKNSGINVL